MCACIVLFGRLAHYGVMCVVYWRMDSEQLLTAEETAALLRLSEHTLASWRRTGRTSDLPWVEVGGLIRYRRGDIQRWLDARTKNGT